ncbi:MAG TPA: porin family protein [Bacteroidia bacterium]|nr:porin family protein [Bacteroidia bacterium]
MKKVLFTIALAAAAFTTQAQSFRLGLGGGVNNTWLANKNVSDQGDELDFAVTFGGSIGLEGLYNFNDKSGISFGFLYSGHNQKYEGKILGGDFNSTVRMRYLDIPILYRITSSSGTYFEVGPQLGFLMKAEEEAEAGSLSNTEDTKDQFNSTNFAGILGFGVDIDASETIIISIGLRLGYGFSDVTKEYGSAAELNAQDVVGTPTLNAHYDDKGNFDYKPTSRIFGGLHLGVSYIFPAKGK